MRRVRRHPLLGAMLLAILTPLLAAGPGMPCAGAAGGHGDEMGHVVSTGGVLTLQGQNGHAAHMTGSRPAMDGPGEPAGETDGPSPVVPSGGSSPLAPQPISCTMGLFCTGTAVAPTAAILVEARVVQAEPGADARWTLHATDSSLPKRPPRA